MDSTLLSGIIGAGGAVIGGLLTSWFSNRITTKVIRQSIDAQQQVFEERRQNEEQKENSLLKLNAQIVSNDIINACIKGFMFIKGENKMFVVTAATMISMNKNYHDIVSSLYKILKPEDIILINNTYSMIEKIVNDIMNLNYVSEISGNIRYDYYILLQTLFSSKYNEIDAWGII